MRIQSLPPLLACLCLLVSAGCAAPGERTVDASGPRGVLNDPGAGTLNSPTTSPTSSGLSGGTAGTDPATEAGGPIAPAPGVNVGVGGGR